MYLYMYMYTGLRGWGMHVRSWDFWIAIPVYMYMGWESYTSSAVRFVILLSLILSRGSGHSEENGSTSQYQVQAQGEGLEGDDVYHSSESESVVEEDGSDREHTESPAEEDDQGPDRRRYQIVTMLQRRTSWL